MREKKNYRSEFKVKIIREHLENQLSISKLSEIHGINPNLIYKWKKEMFESAIEIFNRKHQEVDRKSESKIKTLEERIRQKESVISELVEENIELKKNIAGVS